MVESGQTMKSAENYFGDSQKGNIKEVYHFKEKIAQGGFGIVYLAENRQTKELFAVKAIQKKKVKDYTTFINEINILKLLVSNSSIFDSNSLCRIIRTSSNFKRSGSGMTFASLCSSTALAANFSTTFWRGSI